MKHVIHADNSEFFRKLMRTFLSERGLESESFANGEDVLDAAAAGRVSFVVTGLELTDMSGEILIEKLAALPRKVPVIVVTSNEEAVQTKRLEVLPGVKATILKSGDWKEELGHFLD
jgi:two-component system nitrogen regulation response regulator GlnG